MKVLRMSIVSGLLAFGTARAEVSGELGYYWISSYGLEVQASVTATLWNEAGDCDDHYYWAIAAYVTVNGSPYDGSWNAGAMPCNASFLPLPASDFYLFLPPGNFVCMYVQWAAYGGPAPDVGGYMYEEPYCVYTHY
jgi:hypothetical protein